jgi:hypothetical protein
MALDFTALQTELFARGFDYLNDAGTGLTRAKRWINEAMHEVNATDRWEYLYANSSGVPPLTIADLRLVEDVTLTVSGAPLVAQSRAMLEAVYGTLTTAGASTPTYWYRSAPTVVTDYPLNTSLSISVRYWKFGPDLSAGTDAPLMPDRFRQVIVERAVAKAYRDSQDQAGEQQALNEVERLVALMRLELVPDYLAPPVTAPTPAAVK